ncbi:O-methyltransferase [Desulfurobacterium atlanticum]|uniref:Predicted O-methyltransferase YrrM n=1 Tax=Desulfurobacterium atlanticum TaxID=240169 RepID=A0A238Y9C6_9BACT|nr:O-methyltransferase [Desulfurobacterium atlanticum]SNR67184.1 Predicted O-methyltransferase YrrM [Desulfurobacterium atlanticum]
MEQQFLKNRWNNLSEIIPENVENFISIYNKREPLLIEIEEFAKKEKVPILLPSSANLLKLLCKLKQPRTILEIGTGIGYSTLSILYALNGNCELISVDFNRDRIEIASSFIKKSGFKATLIHNDAFNALRDFLAEGKTFDFIFIDSMKSEYPFFNYKIQALLKENGMAVFDNVLFRGYVCGVHPERYKRAVFLLKKFLKDVKTYPNFENSIIPVGDGLLITERKN